MIPQLRIIAANFCKRSCIYCRPTGEAVATCSKNSFACIEDVIMIAKLYKAQGGSEIKITGGDPVFWKDLPKCVERLKNEVGIESVEVITRSPHIAFVFDDLLMAGLDTLNFSLDTIDPDDYRKIVGKDDFFELRNIICEAAKKINTKINTVVMKGINDSKIDELIGFCETNTIKQLKLLDLIVDMQQPGINNSWRLMRDFGVGFNDLYFPLSAITAKLQERAVKSDVIFQGGLGHPMNRVILNSGLDIRIKDSQNGAWYGSKCKACPMYPCHDALMAIRYLPEKSLQLCLLNEHNNVNLNFATDEEILQAFLCAMSEYSSATFVNKRMEVS